MHIVYQINLSLIKTIEKILKDSFSDILSDNILFRRKQVLLPIRKWFKKGSLNEELKSLINSQSDFEKNDWWFDKKHEVGKYDNSVICGLSIFSLSGMKKIWKIMVKQFKKIKTY